MKVRAIEQPVPWEPPVPGYFNPPPHLVVGNEWRLIKALRDAATSGSALAILTDAVVAQVHEILSTSAPKGLGMALADLSVSGRRAFADFVTRHPQENGPIEAAATAKLSALGTSGVTPALVRAATSEVLDRAYQVLWFLRAQTERGDLGWIAVSGEDDLPHRPVNVPRTSFPQHDLYFTVRWPAGDIAVQTRYAIATAEEPVATAVSLPQRDLPPEVEPTLPEGDQIILFINGSDSRLEEADDLIPKLVRLPDGRPSGLSVIAFDLPGAGYSSSIDHTDVAPWPLIDIWRSMSWPFALLPFMERFIMEFVATLSVRLGEPDLESRIAAVVGGSLGGNLALRLARHPGPWVKNAVAWSAGSVWDDDNDAIWGGVVLGTPRVGEDETAASRDDFFAGYFDQHIPVKTQPEQWYRDDFPLKQQFIASARLDRREVYTPQFRHWHWRVSLEELMWSWQNPSHQDFTSRVLLGAGSADNIWPANIFKNTVKLAYELANVDGDSFFFDDTGHSIHAERPEALADKIIVFLGKSASTDWTNFQIVQGRPWDDSWDYLFAYKAEDGAAAVHDMSTPGDLRNTTAYWERAWATDWTSLQLFWMGGHLFLFAYKAGDGTVAFDEINYNDPLDTNRVWEGKWTTGWTHLQIFPMGDRHYLFAYKGGEGTVQFDEIPSDLQGTDAVWRPVGKWAPDWTSFQIFPMGPGGQNYMFLYKKGNGHAEFDEVPDDLQNTTQLWSGAWTTGWTHFQIFPMAGKNYMFAYKGGDGTVQFDEIRNDLHGTDPVWRPVGKWAPDWTHFQIFPMGGKNYMFAYKALDGTAAFDEIRSDLQNTTPVWRGVWTPG